MEGLACLFCYMVWDGIPLCGHDACTPLLDKGKGTPCKCLWLAG